MNQTEIKYKYIGAVASGLGNMFFYNSSIKG